MTSKVMAFECPSALRKFIPFCEARWRANAARLQCWKGAAMQIPWKWESSRAPRRNPDPVGPGPTKSKIGKRLKSFCETNVSSGELFSPRARPARGRGSSGGRGCSPASMGSVLPRPSSIAAALHSRAAVPRKTE